MSGTGGPVPIPNHAAAEAAGWEQLAKVSRLLAHVDAVKSGDLVPGGQVWTGVEADYDPVRGQLRAPNIDRASGEAVGRVRAAGRALRGRRDQSVHVEDTFRAYEVINSADLLRNFEAGTLTVSDGVRREIERLTAEAS